MAAVTIVDIHKGSNGDILRNRVAFTAAHATTDSVTPQSVGLHEIFAVVPTGRIGAFDGVTLVNGPTMTYNQTSDIIKVFTEDGTAVTTGNVEAFFYGI